MADSDYYTFAAKAAQASALVANYCDRSEHIEPADPEWVAQAGALLLELAQEVAAHEGEDLFELYAERLGAIEERNVLHRHRSFDGRGAVRGLGLGDAPATWRQLQLIQIAHDRHYHPDVLGMSRSDQLRHYSFHLAKLTGALSGRASDDALAPEINERRLPDLLLFGIKLHTVVGRRLPDDPFRA